MFEKYSWNSLVMATRSGEYKYFNVEAESNIEHWFNHAALTPFEHFNRETNVIATLAGVPKVMFYSDRYHEDFKIPSAVSRSIMERQATYYYRDAHF
jgi:hypothetical protein